MFSVQKSLRMRGRNRIAITSGAAVALVASSSLIAAALTSQPVVGPQPDGTAVTPLGQLVHPAGQQTQLGDLPLGSALSPDGRTLVVTNDGQGMQSLQVIDVASGKVVQTLPYASPASLFIGVAFSPDGRTVYASGGGDQAIHVYSVAGQTLTSSTPIALPTTNPAGLRINTFPAGLAVTPDGKRLVVADHLADAVSVIDLATSAVQTVAVGHTPVGVAISRDGSTAWVSNQGANTVSTVSLGSTPAVTRTTTVGTHPDAVRLSKDGSQVLVANGDSDELSVLSAADSSVVKTISLAPYHDARAGSSPFDIAQSADGRTAYVTTAGNNAVDVVDLGRGVVVGRIPTGWYPTGIARAGDRLLVLNAKGLGAGPNDGPGHPDPTSTQPTAANQYVGSMMVGTLSSIPVPDTAQLATDTNQVAHNDGFGQPTDDHGVPVIKHVIYVLQENRTYDQVFGSLGKGNGDPALNLFGEESAPNQRALERKFVTLDNFYADAEISAQGWNWGVAANSNPYSEAMWPSNYSGRGGTYPSENDADNATVPNRSVADAYIWQRLAANHVSFRNYGFYVGASPTDPTSMVGSDPVLNANTDHAYRGFDLSCPDNPDTFAPLKSTCGIPRFTAWKQEFDSYVAHNDLPTVELLRLPNDHTAGTRPGSPTPRSYVADNDLALGRVVDAVSHSPYWKNTVILVTEDDAQNGPDHVDAHRTTAEVISPYTQHGAVDSSLYSTASMLRTIEDIVGVAPLSQFDLFATPLTADFRGAPSMTPYDALVPSQQQVLNTASSPMARMSASQNLTEEDRVDEMAFNEAIWKSVKGANSTMPMPMHGH